MRARVPLPPGRTGMRRFSVPPQRLPRCPHPGSCWRAERQGPARRAPASGCALLRLPAPCRSSHRMQRPPAFRPGPFPPPPRAACSPRSAPYLLRVQPFKLTDGLVGGVQLLLQAVGTRRCCIQVRLWRIQLVDFCLQLFFQLPGVGVTQQLFGKFQCHVSISFLLNTIYLCITKGPP